MVKGNLRNLRETWNPACLKVSVDKDVPEAVRISFHPFITNRGEVKP
jgi:hypothetical protein